MLRQLQEFYAKLCNPKNKKKSSHKGATAITTVPDAAKANCEYNSTSIATAKCPVIQISLHMACSNNIQGL